MKLKTALIIFVILSFVLFIQICTCSETTENTTTQAEEVPEEGPGFFTLFLQSINPWATEETFADLANQLASAKNYEKAIEFYDRVIEKNSFNVLYYVARGNCHKELGDFNAAFWDFDRALSIAINTGQEETLKLVKLHGHEFAEVGRRLYITWKFKEAIYCFNEAIKENRFVASYYNGRALCHEGMKNYEMAISDYRTALELNPRNVDSRVRLSRAMLNLGKYDEALKEILVLDDVPEELVNLCDILRQKGMGKEAISCYTEAIKRRPGNGEYRYRRGMCYLDLGDLDSAIADFKKHVDINPDDIKGGWYHLIGTMFRSGKVKTAINETQVLDNNSLVRLGEEFFNTEKFEEALYIYAEAIKRDSSVALYHRMRADCYMQLKSSYMAIKDMRRAVEIEPNNKDYQSHLGQILYDAGKFDDAIHEILKSDDPNELAQLGSRFFSNGQFADAIFCYTAAIDRDSGNASLYKNRAHCWQKSKKLHEAITDLEQSFKLQTNDRSTAFELCEVLIDVGKLGEAEHVLIYFEAKYGTSLDTSEKKRIQELYQKIANKRYSSGSQLMAKMMYDQKITH